jgi:hypothetical protein
MFIASTLLTRLAAAVTPEPKPNRLAGGTLWDVMRGHNPFEGNA